MTKSEYKRLSVFFLILLLTACSEKLPQLDIPGVSVLEAPLPLEPFSLKDQNAAAFSNSDLRNKWSLVFFGYTHCPDICPNTMLVMNAVQKGLGSKPAYRKIAASTRYLFISVDPYRDTPQRLKEFINYFNEGFVAVSGDIKELVKLSNQLGAPFDYSDPRSDTIFRDLSKAPPIKDYTVTHAAFIYLIDDKGRAVAYIAPPHDADKIIEVYSKLRS